MPSRMRSIASARWIEAKTVRAVGAGEYQRQPGGAVFEVVQRLRVGLRRIGMIDPLHDLPGRRGGAAHDRRGAFRARIERLDPAFRHRSCRPAFRTARPSARRRRACASPHGSRARNSRASGRSVGRWHGSSENCTLPVSSALPLMAAKPNPVWQFPGWIGTSRANSTVHGVVFAILCPAVLCRV